MNRSKRNAKNNKNTRRGLRLLRKFLVTFLLTFVGLCIVGGAVFFGYVRSRLTTVSNDPAANAEARQVANEIGSGLKTPAPPITNLFSGVPKRVNFIIYGLNENLSDSMILGCLNTEKDTLDMVSLPRDLSIVLPQNLLNVLTSHGRNPPSDGAMHLNWIYSFAGSDLGPEIATKEISNLFGVKIDYYVTIDLDAFKYIVTQIGGVDFDVPVRMKYTDPFQDLYIDLQPGMQHLDADQAEQLVRFRKGDKGYAVDAYNDWVRGQTQQQFIKAILKQLMETGTVNSVQTMVTAALQYVKTNFDILDFPKYYSCVSKLTADNINTHSLVGTDQTDSGGTWYTTLDMDASMQIINSIFYDSDADAQAAQASSVGKQIEVLNGGDTSGMAQKTKDMLAGKGFTVAGIGDYTGTKQAATRIIVKSGGMGADLQALFSGSSVTVDAAQCAGAGVDIIVIIGTDEG